MRVAYGCLETITKDKTPVPIATPLAVVLVLDIAAHS